LLLDRGKLLFDGSLKDFERRFASKRRIYPAWLKNLLLFVIPFGSFHYLPGRVLFGKTATLWGLGVAPVAALVLGLVAQAAWNAGLRQYESSGS
jgi:ABC-2 type transport system permease protein